MNTLIISTLLLLPLFFLPGYTNSFDLPKNLIIRSLVILMIYVYCTLLVKDGKLSLNLKRFTAPLSLIFFGIFAVFSLSTIFSDARLQAFFGHYQRQLGFLSWIFVLLFFVMLLLSLNLKNIKKISGAVVVSSAIVSFYAILQHLGIDPLFGNFNDDIFEGRVYATLGNPDFLAQYIVPIVPLIIVFIFLVKKNIFKILLGINFILVLAALFFTQSRASLLALILGGLVFFIFLIKEKIISFKKVFIIGILGLIMLPIFFLTPLKNLPLINRVNSDPTNMRSMQSRFAIWEGAVNLIKDHPLLGTGVDTFNIYFPEYANPKLYELEENLNIIVDREHNELLQFGVWGGIPAIILYILMVIFAVKTYFKFNIRSPLLVHGFYLGFFIIIFQNIFSFSSISHYILMTFFLANMIIFDLKTNDKKSVYGFSEKLKILIIPVAISCLLFWNETVLVPLRVETAYSNANFSSLTTDDLFNYLIEAINLNPNSAFLYYNLVMRDRDTIPFAAKNLERIEGKTVNVLAWQANYYAKKDFELATKYYEDALKLNPKFLPVMKAYADATYANKNCLKATERYENFLEFAPVFWKWRYELREKTDAQKKSYRIFFKNTPDFHIMFKRLKECYEELGNKEKATFYSKYLAP